MENSVNNTWKNEYPQFNPDYTPVAMFKLGIFCGAYFVENQIPGHWQDSVPKNFLVNFNSNETDLLLINDKPTVQLNKFAVQSGSSYNDWIEKGWINKQDPYGWVNWYINFFYGRRSTDDKRQIGRWCAFKGRHSGTLRRTGNPKNETHGFKTRQNMLHWAIDAKQIPSNLPYNGIL